jgi:hypothetical protein
MPKTSNSRSAHEQAKIGWRDVLPIHPAADLFPLMAPAELHQLGTDIRAHGLCEPVVFIQQYKRRRDGTPIYNKYDLALLDGRNRLDAMEAAGIRLIFDGELDPYLGQTEDRPGPKKDYWSELPPETDAYAYVISANIHRRHLSTEQKRDLIAKLLKATPERSNNATAKIAKVDDKTVGAVRADLERRSEIPNVKTRTDTKGRQQPAKKSSAKPAPAPIVPVAVAPIITAEAAGAAAQITKIAHEMIALESSWAGEAVSASLLALMAEAVTAWAALTKRLATQVQVAPPPVDDGIPDFLRRKPPAERIVSPLIRSASPPAQMPAAPIFSPKEHTP